MYSTQLYTQAIDYQKTVFDTSFSIMETVQEQGQEFMDMAIEKNPMIPDGSRKMCSYWMDFLRQNRANCKDYMDTSFDRIKEFLDDPEPAPAPAPAPAKNTKKSA